MTQLIIDHLSERVTIRLPAGCDMAFVASTTHQLQPRFIVAEDFPLDILRAAFEVKEDWSRSLRKGAHIRDVAIPPFNSKCVYSFNPYTWEKAATDEAIYHKKEPCHNVMVVGVNTLEEQKPLYIMLPHQLYEDDVRHMEIDYDPVRIFCAPMCSDDRVFIERDELEAPRARKV